MKSHFKGNSKYRKIFVNQAGYTQNATIWKHSVSHKCIRRSKANLSYCILRHNSILLYTLKLLSSFTFQREWFCFIIHIMIISRIINMKNLILHQFFRPQELCKILISSSWFYFVLLKKIHTTREDDLWNTMIQCLLNILQNWLGRFSISGEHLIGSSLGP